jgi:putative redox protein
MYADKKGWEVERIEVETGVRIDRTDAGQTSHFETEVSITGNVSTEQKERLLEIARKCPIHRLLTNPINILTDLKQDA